MHVGIGPVSVMLWSVLISRVKVEYISMLVARHVSHIIKNCDKL